MLIGEYQHNIDSKGRVIVPVKFREDLGECFYVTKGLDGCLFVLSGEGWKGLQEKILRLAGQMESQLQRKRILVMRLVVADDEAEIARQEQAVQQLNHQMMTKLQPSKQRMNTVMNC